MTQLFRLSNATRNSPDVRAWFASDDDGMRRLALPWFEVIRALGDDVVEVLHDGHPTACVGDAAFSCVNAFSAHANIGFFHGAALADPEGLLEGSGKRLRHFKVRWGEAVNEEAIKALINAAYLDIRARIAAEKAALRPYP